MSSNYDGLTRNIWPGTWSASASQPVVLDTELRGALQTISGGVGDELSNIAGQRLQEGMLVYVVNGYTSGLFTRTGDSYYTYKLLVAQSRDINTGAMPNAEDNWILVTFGGSASTGNIRFASDTVYNVFPQNDIILELGGTNDWTFSPSGTLTTPPNPKLITSTLDGNLNVVSHTTILSGNTTISGVASAYVDITGPLSTGSNTWINNAVAFNGTNTFYLLTKDTGATITPYIGKLDSYGSVLWENTVLNASSIAADITGGCLYYAPLYSPLIAEYLMLGFNSGTDACIQQINTTTGAILSTNILSMAGNTMTIEEITISRASSVTTGDTVAVGTVGDGASSTGYIWTPSWSKSLGGSGNFDTAITVSSSIGTDSNIFIAGQWYNSGLSLMQTYVASVDTSGNKIWVSSIDDGTGVNTIHSISADISAVVCISSNTSGQLIITGINASTGAILWQKRRGLDAGPSTILNASAVSIFGTVYVNAGISSDDAVAYPHILSFGVNPLTGNFIGVQTLRNSSGITLYSSAADPLGSNSSVIFGGSTIFSPNTASNGFMVIVPQPGVLTGQTPENWIYEGVASNFDILATTALDITSIFSISTITVTTATPSWSTQTDSPNNLLKNLRFSGNGVIYGLGEVDISDYGNILHLKGKGQAGELQWTFTPTNSSLLLPAFSSAVQGFAVPEKTIVGSVGYVDGNGTTASGGSGFVTIWSTPGLGMSIKMIIKLQFGWNNFADTETVELLINTRNNGETQDIFYSIGNRIRTNEAIPFSVIEPDYVGGNVIVKLDTSSGGFFISGGGPITFDIIQLAVGTD